MDKAVLIKMLLAMEGDDVKIEGRVPDEHSEIGIMDVLDDGSIVLRPE
jgi:hypothetical protein